MNNPHAHLAPFSCSYTPNTPELLQKLKCTIAISTYQAGKLIFLSALDDEKIIQLPRSFEKLMGIAVDKNKMALACKDEVIVFGNSKELAQHYPKKPNTYDAMYMPRASYHTGMIDAHDLDFCNEGLCAINTNFSCISKVDENYSFTPIWTPKFISDIQAGDRCHLNGMAVENRKIKYLTAFSQTDSSRGWVDTMTKSGVLMDYKSKELLATELAMPHSPRIYQGKLYLLLSATGEFVTINPSNGHQTVITKIDGFVRGLSFHAGLAFIGISKLRKNSSSFGKLDIASKSKAAGILIVHLESGSVIAKFVYQSSVDEIYDIQILPNMVRPSILNTIKDDYKKALCIPEKTFWSSLKTD